MEDFARNLVTISANMKNLREEFNPAKSRLMSEMQSSNVDSIPCGEHVIKLHSKPVKKPCGIRKIEQIIQKEFGPEGLKTFKQARKEAQSESVIKFSLKIEDA
ncbi:hypothetical protein JKP88DRAFT_240955 [Tribonema minus]|uniref:Uncharacterized protein n=1 Tax=Tribonema minus TaxID=303371 RepID=A0A836CIC9_9STRA|nr:hypothetical protein JKP88DRAFT_240955 [Tribonema minus]